METTTTPQMQATETLEIKPAKPIGVDEIVEQVALDCRVNAREYLDETKAVGGGE